MGCGPPALGVKRQSGFAVILEQGRQRPSEPADLGQLIVHVGRDPDPARGRVRPADDRHLDSVVRVELILEGLLAEFSISHLRRTPALALSGGERRRVEIARALASSPHFILLDEPFAGIDPVAVSDIRELVVHLKDRGIGVLITDHNVRETLDIIDRAYIIHDGMMLMEGTSKDIIANEEVRRVYLGERFRL